MVDNPFRDAFYAYAKTRRGLSTVNYEMIEAMIKRAGLFVPPGFNESVFQREFRKLCGASENKERDFHEFMEICQKIIAPLYAKAKSVSNDEAMSAVQEAFIQHQPKSVADKVIK